MDEYCKSNYGLPTDVYVEGHLRTGQVRFYWDFGRTCDCVTLSNANMTSTSMYLHVADYMQLHTDYTQEENGQHYFMICALTLKG